MIRVLVADDSSTVRLALSGALRRIPSVEVVGTATDGNEAISKAIALRPDLVTLDLEMPNRDGVSAAVDIHRHCPQAVLALVSGTAPSSVQAALSVAPHLPIEYMAKPSSGVSFDEWVAAHLAPLIERLLDRKAEAPAPARPAPVRPPRPMGRRIEAVLVGASTGGPAAVTTFLQGLDPAIGVPVLIVQHMPAGFTDTFARNLGTRTAWQAQEATDGAVPRRGEAWVARGDAHLRIERRQGELVLRLGDGPREHGCRPAVDVTWRTAATALGGACVGVMLTGMGRDGTLGAALLQAEGASFVAQDEATSVVWGMPGSLVRAGLAQAVLPLPEIADWVAKHVRAANGPPG